MRGRGAKARLEMFPAQPRKASKLSVFPETFPVPLLKVENLIRYFDDPRVVSPVRHSAPLALADFKHSLLPLFRLVELWDLQGGFVMILKVCYFALARLFVLLLLITNTDRYRRLFLSSRLFRHAQSTSSSRYTIPFPHIMDGPGPNAHDSSVLSCFPACFASNKVFHYSSHTPSMTPSARPLYT
jgi:hypothetical protein